MTHYIVCRHCRVIISPIMYHTHIHTRPTYTHTPHGLPTHSTYDFIDVCSWFASRCDLILLLFDPHKLDISDEFKQVRGPLLGTKGGRHYCSKHWTEV